ncbi:MAG: ABC transporter substrate-binding protein, partial [Symploca sp. SIO1A3]|nr:ABC transporter substrate-binding protein [Symploca sp. SIO1A3]
MIVNPYQVGGSLELNHSTYIVRQADDDLYNALSRGEFCYILNSRQTGKSSLRVRAMHKLQADGIACADIDLSAVGSGKQTGKEEWYRGIIKELISCFQLKVNRRDWWHEHDDLSPVDRFGEFIKEVLLAQVSKNIVIFVDEIDSVLSLKFSTDDFFALIRACYNKRADHSEYNRLTFVLLGVATPSDLIKNKVLTPFNIGQAIQLNGFQLDEIQPLAKELEGKVSDPQAVLKEILNWTGGQPFLTQKLCRLIFDCESPIPSGSEAELVEDLVRTQVIENWETQDNPVHLKTIRDRLLQNANQTVLLLELYRKILQQGEINADGSSGQKELRLSGLVVEQQGKLRVYNSIYQQVFDNNFVEDKLSNLRPYVESFAAWKENKQDKSKLLQGRALREAQKWSEGKSLSPDDYEFLAASEKQQIWKKFKFAAWAGLIIPIGILGYWNTHIVCPSGQVRLKSVGALENSCFSVSSSGDDIFFRNQRNLDLERGVEAFKSEKYSQAIESFEKAIKSSPNNPEPQIYLNNAKARLQGSTLVVAVVAPIDHQADSAKEILRGIADAQAQFNQSQPEPSPLLEIIIANDGNDEDTAKKVAKQLANNPKILAVIGHNSSEASQAALPEYQQAGLAFITSTATSTELGIATNTKSERSVFFRVLPSNKEAGEKLAGYAKQKDLDRVVIFYDSESTYSNTLKEEFEKKYTDNGGQVVESVDLRGSNFNAE